MAISSDNVKAVLLAGFGLAIGYTVWKLYDKAGKMGVDIVTAAGEIEKDLVNGISSLGNTVANMSAELKNAVTKDIPDYMAMQVNRSAQSVKQTLGMPSTVASGSNAQFSGPTYTKQLSIAEWDASTKTFIKSLMKATGTYKSGFLGADYTGWQVFSDGTIIGPDGTYYQMDYSSPAMDTADGFAVNLIWSPFDATSNSLQ